MVESSDHPDSVEGVAPHDVPVHDAASHGAGAHDAGSHDAGFHDASTKDGTGKVLAVNDVSTRETAARDVALKLLQAASHGENLMRELDYLNGRPKGQPSQPDVLKKMIESRSSEEFGNIELLDGTGQPITNSRLAANVQSIVKRGDDGKTETLYKFPFAEDGRQLFNDDTSNILLEKKLEPRHSEDVKKIVDAYQKAVDDMVASGHRLSGEGPVMGMVNNIARAYVDSKYGDCVEQSLNVLNKLRKLELEGQWNFHMVGDPPHYKVEVVPENAADPIIRLDPWRGREHYELDEGGKSPPDSRLNPWADDQFKIHWS